MIGMPQLFPSRLSHPRLVFQVSNNTGGKMLVISQDATVERRLIQELNPNFSSPPCSSKEGGEAGGTNKGISPEAVTILRR